MKKSATILGLAILAGCSDSQISPTSPPDNQTVLYHQGKIYTENIEQPWADAMITRADRIIFVGSLDEALGHESAPATKVNLQGKFVMPGMIDTHTHPGLIGMFQRDDKATREDSQIPYPASKEEMLQWLRGYGDRNFWSPMIFAGSWDVNTFLPDGPNRKDLDEIFPYKPVVLMDNSGHSLWLNSSALTLLGVDKNEPALSPGISYFVRDEQGELTGWAKEFALFPHIGDLLVPSKKELKSGIREFLQSLSKQGITTLWDAGNFAWHDHIYEAVAELDKEGKLPLRYEGSFHIWAPEHLHQAVAEIKRLRRKYSGERLNFNTVKIHYDGVADIKTAGMLEPYANDPDNRGAVLFDAERLQAFILQLNSEGIHLHLHTVGDRATREALNAVEMARQQGPIDIEIALSHLETVAPEDILRFKPLEVHANFTPHWFGGTVFGEAAATNLGHERAQRSQVANQFVQAGANVTLSSDVVTEEEAYRANPFIGLQMSVTREEYAGGQQEILPPESARLDLASALSAYTLNGARQLGLSSDLGSLEIGKKADFVVLSQNPFEVDIRQVHQLVPDAVYLDGVVLDTD
jgi:predicted amidohydrolase YtcJ